MSIFQIIFIFLVSTAFATSGYYRAKSGYLKKPDFSREGEGQGILRFRLIGIILTWVSLAILMIHPPWLDWGSLDLPQWLRWVGVGIAVIAIPLFHWVFISLSDNITDSVVVLRQHKLCTTGPYRWVRHPLYTVSAIFFIGLSLMMANWFLLVSFAFSFVVILARTPIEEANLLKQYPEEYADYMRRTGAYLPRFRRRR